MSRARIIQLGRGVGALLGLLVLLVGLPVVLAVVAGWPLPHGLPDLISLRRALEDGWSPDGTVVIKALAIVCWFAWAELAACAVAEGLAAVRGRRRAMRVPLAGPLQPFVANLVAAVLMALSTAGTRGVPARPSSLAAAVAAHRAIPLDVHLVSSAADPVQSSSGVDVASAVAPAPAPAPKQIVVRHRDDLWDLAEHHLGDPLRWREIWELNRARPQPDGRLFSDPDLIRPGLVLELPAHAPGADPVAALPVGIPLRSPDLNGPVLSPAVEVSTVPTTAESESDGAKPLSPRTTPSLEESPTHGRSLRSLPPTSVQLPSGSTVAASFAAGVAAAVAAGRLRRRRAYRPSVPEPAVPHPPPDVGPATQALLRAVSMPRAEQDDAFAEETPESTVPFPFIGLHDPEPGRLAIGGRGSDPVERTPVEVEVTGLGGLALDGPGAPDVIRALVAGLLAKGGPYVTRLVVPEDTASRLLPGIGAVAGVRVVADLDAALTEAEVELLHRTRLLGTEDFPDFATYRRQRADLPPAVVIVTDEASGHEHGRLRAVAELGRRLGLGLIVCGSDGGCVARLHIDEQGSASHVGPEILAAVPDDARLHRLAEGEFAELVGALAAARAEAPESLEAAVDYAPRVAAPPTSEPDEGMAPPVTGLSVRVQLFGPYRIEVDTKEIRTGLRSSARELLAYHLLRPEGATVERAVDALWPEVDLARGPERFWTALGNLRSRVRKETGAEQSLIDKDGERYRVAAGVFDVDLWTFQAALAEAREAPDDDALEAALEQAAVAYGGELLEGSFYEWAEPMREVLLRNHGSPS